ncbi:MAG: hypothetical protein QNJ98_17990, partial [Planctomycetota bacterium]|nr:hypothetical protein [Planctomycetota bacterium]
MLKRAHRTRLAILLLALVAPFFAACGDEAAGPEPKPEPETTQSTEPPAIRMTFALDADAAVLQETIATVGERLALAGAAGATVEAAGEGRFRVDLPEALRERQEELRELLTTLGTLEFRIQALPEKNTHEDQKRASAWNGSAEGFAKWKQAEFDRLKQLEAAGKAYAPVEGTDTAGCYLVRRQGRDGAKPDDYEVVEVPAKEEHFDGTILNMAHVSRDPHAGMPVVLFEIKPDHVERFRAWTAKNVGLPMAIIVNGEFTGDGRAPTIQAPLSDSVQITLGAMKFA